MSKIVEIKRLEAEIERFHTRLETHGERVLTALDNCMHEYGEDVDGLAARERVNTALHAVYTSEEIQ